MTLNAQKRPRGIVSFIRYNVSALAATACDFLVLLLLTEILLLWYVISVGVGALAGACVAFFLGRNWAFVSKNERKRVQAFRYLIVALGSIGLNLAGVYFFTETVGFVYTTSKVITAILVGFGYNYPLGKYFIFK